MRRRAAFGLRGRFVTALVLTSAITLGVAAVALFSPLERQLRTDEVQSLREAEPAARASLARLSSDDLHRGSAVLRRLVRTLRRRTVAQVVVVGADGAPLAGTDADPGDRFPEGLRAIAAHRTLHAFIGSGSEQEALIASPVTVDGERVALVLRRPLGEVRSAVDVVEGAFVTAALAGLTVALVIGLLLAARLVRRLRALTSTVARIAEVGPAVELASDGSADEVGALTRSFAQMQQRLNEQESARRTFVATASHELRTPLASLQLMLDGLVEDLQDADPDLMDAREQALRALSQSGLLSKLSGELLDLSRIDAGLALRCEPVELRELARSVIAEFGARLIAERRSVRATGAKRSWALADPGSLAQIVRILIDNALRFAPEHSTITVSIGASATAATIRVADKGPGVAAHEHELIFERFRRGSETSGYSGFGLGLAIGRELARRMDGDLTISEMAPGASFVLSLKPATGLTNGDTT